MRKFTKDEYIERTNEIENILFKNLKLRNVLTNEELNEFFMNMIAYLEHSSSEEIVGRRTETLEKDIETFVNFSKKIGLNDREIIQSIMNFPSIIHSLKDFEHKYYLMSLVENEDNTLRKTKLVERPRDFIISLETLYARYSLANTLNYKLTWNSLVKSSEKEFASIFTKTNYDKPYKIFTAIEECTDKRLKEMYPIDYDFLKQLKKDELNIFGGLSENNREK